MGATTKQTCPVCGSDTAIQAVGITETHYLLEVLCRDCWIKSGQCKGCKIKPCLKCRVIHVTGEVLKSDCDKNCAKEVCR